MFYSCLLTNAKCFLDGDAVVAFFYFACMAVGYLYIDRLLNAYLSNKNEMQR